MTDPAAAAALSALLGDEADTETRLRKSKVDRALGSDGLAGARVAKTILAAPGMGEPQYGRPEIRVREVEVAPGTSLPIQTSKPVPAEPVNLAGAEAVRAGLHDAVERAWADMSRAAAWNGALWSAIGAVVEAVSRAPWPRCACGHVATRTAGGQFVCDEHGTTLDSADAPWASAMRRLK